jgi:hypothetical protein
LNTGFWAPGNVLVKPFMTKLYWTAIGIGPSGDNALFLGIGVRLAEGALVGKSLLASGPPAAGLRSSRPASGGLKDVAPQHFLIGSVDKAIDFPAARGIWAARALRWSTYFAMGAK